MADLLHSISWEHEGEVKSVQMLLGETATIEKHFDSKPVDKKIKNKKECGGCNNKARSLRELIVGGAKLLKAELGVDACDDATIIDRRNICESCEHYDFGVCNQCGCFCAAKVKLKTEVCPEGKW